MSDRQTNTMAEGLQKLLSDIAAMQAAPDADLDFLGQLQTVILTKIRAPFDQTQNSQAGMGGAPSPDSQGPSPQQFGPANVPGTRNPGATPNADELRRVIANSGQGMG